MIDTEKDQYLATRKWAKAIDCQYTDVQGLSWVSRQDASARAVVLVGDRFSEGSLHPQGASRSMTEDSTVFDTVLNLAERGRYHRRKS